MKKSVLAIWIAIFITGCNSNAYTNIKLNTSKNDEAIKATHSVTNREGSDKDALVILALSGGGSRAAYFSSSIMLSLDKMGILKEVDVISSVSGGSLPAAYYAISKDPDNATSKDRVWEEKTVKNLMSEDYTRKWIYKWFWPPTIFKYWLTNYNRSDIMAQTFSDNIFSENSILGNEYEFKDLNPNRPTIIINCTNSTTGNFAKLFTFTREDFDKIHSDLGDYKISRAVMASASFPSVFNYMNLRDFSSDNKYVHMFDGGNFDNLGLNSVYWLLDWVNQKYKKIILILVDSFIESKGISEHVPDGRGWYDYVIDFNFIDSLDSLLSANRESIVENGINKLEFYKGEQKSVIFYHIKFDNVKVFDEKLDPEKKLYPKLNSIKTDFKIDEEGKDSIEKLMQLFMTNDNTCLQRIKSILSGDSKTTDESTYCTWPQIVEDRVRIDRAPKKQANCK